METFSFCTWLLLLQTALGWLLPLQKKPWVGKSLGLVTNSLGLGKALGWLILKGLRVGLTK